MFRSNKGIKEGLAPSPMGLKRPEEKRVLGHEVPPKLLTVAIPKLLTQYASTQRSKEQPPDYQPEWVIQP